MIDDESEEQTMYSVANQLSEVEMAIIKYKITLA